MSIEIPLTVTLQHCWEAVKIFGPVGVLLLLTIIIGVKE
jgi:hypothetical protein